METALACLLVLAISVPLSNAACFFQPLKPVKSDGEIIGCRDSKGELHEIGSSWRTNDCLRCSCLKDGIDCCTDYATPSIYDREKCISIFNKVTCTYKVVEKDDHSKVCPVHGWVA